MKRINIFVKGNVDLHDSLIYSRINGRIGWNGMNTLLAEAHPDHVVRARHEPCAHWRLAGIEERPIPHQLHGRELDLGTFTLDAQFRSHLLRQPYDVVVLSIQSNVTNRIWRARDGAGDFFPSRSDIWPSEEVAWLESEFVELALSTPAESMNDLARLVETLRAHSNPTVMVYNMTAALPGDYITSYKGFEDSMATRIRAFNLALIHAAAGLDISVVDVDQIIARGGADRLKLDALHCTADGNRLLAAEAIRLMAAHGHLDH